MITRSWELLLCCTIIVCRLTDAFDLPPIFSSPEITTVQTTLGFKNVTPVECTATSTLSYATNGTALHWSSNKPPYITPLMACGVAEHSVDKCSQSRGEVRIDFVDPTVGRVLSVKNVTRSMPGTICVQLPLCRLLEAFNAEGFQADLQHMQVNLSFTVSGVKSPKQRFTLALEGTSIYDKRTASTSSELQPYQTMREGPAVYAVPWDKCRTFGRQDAPPYSTSCVPAIDTLPAYPAIHHRYAVSLDPSPRYPICAPLPSPYIPSDAKSVDQALGPGALSVAEILIIDAENAIFGTSDLYTKRATLL